MSAVFFEYLMYLLCIIFGYIIKHDIILKSVTTVGCKTKILQAERNRYAGIISA